MKLRTKIAIFLVAMLITFAGFNLLASPSVLDIFDFGGVRGQDIVVTVTAGLGSLPNTVIQFSG